MTISNIISQSPIPKIEIIDYKTNKVLVIQKELQSYTWQLSINDISGSFNISLFPEKTDSKINDNSYFDKINVLDIVKIYEDAAEKNPSFDNQRQKKPVFIGIIKTKKYASQATDSGGIRRISISGTSITGLIANFGINFDTTALALTNKLLNESNIQKKLTEQLTKDSKDVKLKNVIKVIWDAFLNVSEQFGTIKINELINTFMGSDFFDCDDKYAFKYPLGSVFRGESTQNFFNVTDGLIPPPIYEKYAFCNSDGKMKIKIRECPFASEDWKKIKSIKLSPVQIKAIDLEESDKEVYTIFYTYLSGYPLADAKLTRINTQEESIETTVKKADEKFGIYGYKPLFAHLIGYSSNKTENDTDTLENLGKMSEQLKKWYENIEQMLKGSVTIAMNFQGDLIMPGDKVAFIGQEFYVEGVSHSWNYGASGEINISVSRGGKYDTLGNWSKADNFTSRMALFESGIKD